MTEHEYTTERDSWLTKLAAIPLRKHFPLCVKYCITRLAKLEAEYKGTNYNEELRRLTDIYLWTTTS